MRVWIGALIIAALAPLAAPAEEPVGPGCWTRAYTAEHLAAHPGQEIRVITAEIEEQGDNQYLYGGLDITLRDGREYGTPVLCWIDDGSGKRRCAIECDGGGYSLTLRASDDSVLLHHDTGGLRMSDCAEGYSVPGDAEHETFRLYPCR